MKPPLLMRLPLLLKQPDQHDTRLLASCHLWASQRVEAALAAMVMGPVMAKVVGAMRLVPLLVKAVAQPSFAMEIDGLGENDRVVVKIEATELATVVAAVVRTVRAKTEEQVRGAATAVAVPWAEEVEEMTTVGVG